MKTTWRCGCPVLAVMLFLSGCQTVPETGRSRILLTSAAEESRMGLSAFEEIKQKLPISRDPARNARVQRIGARLREVIGPDLPDAQWEFVVFVSDELNAFALPGGKVGIYTGLMDFVDNDAELAAVIGHEIAHVVLRHGGERMSNKMLAGLAGAAVVVGSEGRRDGDWARVIGGLAITGTVLAYSREHESEADRVGARYAARAGYDPRAAVDFWRKMLAQSGQKPAFARYFSTHPLGQDRIAALQGWMPELLPLYETGRQRFAGRE